LINCRTFQPKIRTMSKNAIFGLSITMLQLYQKPIKFVFLSIFVLAMMSCGQKKQASLPDGWTQYELSDYSIAYPKEWKLDNSGQMGTAFQLLAVQTVSDGNFRRNVNLVVQDLKGQSIRTLEQFSQLSEMQIRSMLKGSSILSSEKHRTNGQEYQRVEFTSIQEAVPLMHIQYYLVSGERAYILTLTCPQSTFDQYLSEGERILNSFKLKK
jgi:hypothetical protein